MKRAIAILILAGASCAEPPKQNRAVLYYQGLEDMWRWHPSRGGGGDPSYDGLMFLDPTDSVPTLIRGLSDLAPTKIEDQIHDPPPVGNVCFHMLLALFILEPKDFENEGVWVSRAEPSALYGVHLDDATIRRRVADKFRRLAIERGWMEAPPKE